MDGSTWILEHGADFFADVRSFRNRCHAKATDVGMRVTVNVITLPEKALREARKWLATTDHGNPDTSAGAIYTLIERHYPGGWEQLLTDHDLTVPSLKHVLNQDPADWRIIVRARFYDEGATAG